MLQACKMTASQLLVPTGFMSFTGNPRYGTSPREWGLAKESLD